MFHKRPHGRFGFLDRLDRCFLRAFGQGFDRPAFARNLPVYFSFQRPDFRRFSTPV